MNTPAALCEINRLLESFTPKYSALATAEILRLAQEQAKATTSDPDRANIHAAVSVTLELVAQHMLPPERN